LGSPGTLGFGENAVGINLVFEPACEPLADLGEGRARILA
jgi:hypothetical protein